MSRGSGVAGFGANEWMVEEMRDAWRSDPASVGPRWRSLFEAEAAAPAATVESSDAGSTAAGPAASQSVAAGPAESPGPEAVS